MTLLVQAARRRVIPLVYSGAPAGTTVILTPDHVQMPPPGGEEGEGSGPLPPGDVPWPFVGGGAGLPASSETLVPGHVEAGVVAGENEPRTGCS
jgi:hypothetical protein